MDTETQHLPQDLITGILLRLPVKSLVRFKAVCKFWRSLISDPHFARSHFELAAPRLMFSALYGIRTLDIEQSLHTIPTSEALNIDYSSTDPIPGAVSLDFYPPFRIEGSCIGFLLLNYNGSLYLWNPSTRVRKLIPSSSIYTYNHRRLYGFGYDSSKDDYLVVQIRVATRSYLTTRLAHRQYFSLRANMWTDIEDTDLSRLNFSLGQRPGLFFNGAIHWLADDAVIITFDLVEKRLLEIPGPSDLAHDLSNCELWVHGRFLSLSLSSSDKLEIFVMEKYKVESSWTKTLVLSLNCIALSPIYSTTSGDIVMAGRTRVVKYSDKGEQLEHREYRSCCYRLSLVPVYKESILSLPGVGV